MSRAEDIVHELRDDGELSRSIWDVTRWLTFKQVSYNLPKGASIPIIEGWEARGINKKETMKYREWEALSKHEAALRAELAEIIRRRSEQERQSQESQESP